MLSMLTIVQYWWQRPVLGACGIAFRISGAQTEIYVLCLYLDHTVQLNPETLCLVPADPELAGRFVPL